MSLTRKEKVPNPTRIEVLSWLEKSASAQLQIFQMTHFEFLFPDWQNHMSEENVARVISLINFLLPHPHTTHTPTEYKNMIFGALYEGLSLIPLLVEVDRLNSSLTEDESHFTVATPTETLTSYLVFLGLMGASGIRPLYNGNDAISGLTCKLPLYQSFTAQARGVGATFPVADFLIQKGDQIVGVVETTAMTFPPERFRDFSWTDAARSTVDSEWKKLAYKPLYFWDKISRAILVWGNAKNRKEKTNFDDLSWLYIIGESRYLPDRNDLQLRTDLKSEKIQRIASLQSFKGQPPLEVRVLDHGFDKSKIRRISAEIYELLTRA